MSVFSDLLIRLPSDLLSAVGYDRHVTLEAAYFGKALKKELSKQVRCRHPKARENLKTLANNGPHDHARASVYGRSITTPTPSASATAPGLVILIRKLSTENSANTIAAK